jgi:hypothetical protein
VLHNFWWGSTRKAKGHVGLLGMTWSNLNILGS